MNDVESVVRDLGKEKSLTAIAYAVRRVPPSKLNVFAPLAFGLVSTVAFYKLGGDLGQVLALARDATRIAINSAVALMGFYLSGFAIFATLGDKALFVAMAKTPNEKFEISYFKYNFFVLIRALILAILIAFLLLVCMLCLGPGTGLGQILPRLHPSAPRACACAALGFAAGSMLALLLTTGAFVANVYVTVATSVQWAILSDAAGRSKPFLRDRGDSHSSTGQEEDSKT